jgi:histone acetyltransferase (RNA polymerase elongator complex component)
MPLVIPIFIPHQGCPQQCLFCNQHSITGDKEDPNNVVAQIPVVIREWLARPRNSQPVQVAFFGGSFTCLPQSRQIELLAAVKPFLRPQGMDVPVSLAPGMDEERPQGMVAPVSLTPGINDDLPAQVDSIRISTRPDCVDPATCSFLWSQGVRIVELGVQSLDDKVLQASRRGHTAEQCRLAVGMLQAAGMEVGVQLLPGLPLETTGSFLRTVREVVALAPSFVRLYPVLVVQHAGLATMYLQGAYRPLSMNRAIALSCRAKEILEAAAIRVVRIGLQPSASLERELVAGPYHPAFGELVAARIWFNRIRPLLAGCPDGRRLTVRVSHRDLSAIVGMKRANMLRFEQLGLIDRLEILTDTNIQRGTLEYAVN